MLKEYKTDQIRNVVIAGHGDTGKSTLFEAMLFVGGQIDKMGSRDGGNLVSDFDQDEKDKHMSIRSAMGFVEHDGVKINILDTPGKVGFIGEARAAMQVAEAAIIVIDSVDGVQIQTESAWRFLEENNIPRIIFVNKMDKERANYESVIGNIKSSFSGSFVSVCLPNGEGESFSGIVDTIDMKLMTPKDGGKGVTVSDIPAEMRELAEMERLNLMELAAEGKDELIEKFLEEENLSDEEIKEGLKAQVTNAKLFPVICGSSEKVIGIKNLLNTIKNYAPAPFMEKEYSARESGKGGAEKKIKSSATGPMAAIVWKTYIDQYAGRFNYLKVVSGVVIPDNEVLNSSKNEKERLSKLHAMIGSKTVDLPKINAGDIGVAVKLDKTTTLNTLTDPKNPVFLDYIKLPQPVFSYAVEAKNKPDVDKIGQYFNRITDENPTITYQYNSETSESVLSGMGEMQLDIIIKSMLERNKLEVLTREPRVAYRETITKSAEAQYKHKKQSGGHGQYGEVYFRMKPLARGEGYTFINSIVGGVVPKGYIPGVEKGIQDAMNEGVLGKYPVIDVSVELYDGSYHDVDSSEMSFKIAARNCFKKGMESATPILLEPIMNLKVFVNKEYMGDILSDVTSRRGKVLGMDDASDSGGNISVVKATAPLAELLRYTIDLRAMTSGKASFEMDFSHYDPITGKEAEKVLQMRQKQLDDEAK